MPSKKKTPSRRPRPAPPAASTKRLAKKPASIKSKSKPATTRVAARTAHRSSSVATSGLLNVLARYGVLRSLLAIAAVLLIVFATSPNVAPVYSGWPFIPSLLVPVLAPLILMLLLLDALMGRVLMSDMRGDERARRRDAVIVNLLLAAGLLLRWVPYYLALGK